MNCRFCKSKLNLNFIDLGFAPPSNAYINKAMLASPEVTYPLKVAVCESCWLVQTEDYTQADQLFDKDYAYFSSTSSSWLSHAEDYCKKIVKKLYLNNENFVVEIASNDGYLLKNFVALDIPCLGIEPTESTANYSMQFNIPVIKKFFGEKLSHEIVSSYQKADLVIGNNVYAHVPDILDFTLGISNLLNEEGVVTLEFPHLLNLVEESQFDTIYHEHFSYLSLGTVKQIFAEAGLKIFDVETLDTHGGSLRVYGSKETSHRNIEDSVNQVLQKENDISLFSKETFSSFQSKAEDIKFNLLRFLLEKKLEGKIVAGYGAAAKGNTLLNFSGIKQDLISYVCDAAESKQNKFMPGSHIPILHPSVLESNPPDFLIIFPWNISDEIVNQLDSIKKKGTEMVIAVPELKIL